MSERDELVFSGQIDEFAQDRRQFQKWREREHNGLEDDQQTEQSDIVTFYLLFLADGYENGDLAARAVALVFLLRPDLLSHQTYAGVAKQLRVAPSVLLRAVRTLRDTGVVGPVRNLIKPAKLTHGQLRARRFRLWKDHLERVDLARKLISSERALSADKKSIPPYSCMEQMPSAKRLRAAKRTLALASPIMIQHALEMAAFDAALGIQPMDKSADTNRPSDQELLNDRQRSEAEAALRLARIHQSAAERVLRSKGGA
jgi:hypothetical protein